MPNLLIPTRTILIVVAFICHLGFNCAFLLFFLLPGLSLFAIAVGCQLDAVGDFETIKDTLYRQRISAANVDTVFLRKNKQPVKRKISNAIVLVFIAIYVLEAVAMIIGITFTIFVFWTQRFRLKRACYQPRCL